jgi:hypothetical protein
MVVPFGAALKETVCMLIVILGLIATSMARLV